MILRSDYPFWFTKDGLSYTFPKLNINFESDVVIVGQGISGALMRYFLIDSGINCVLLNSRTIDLGSIRANTPLLQYQIDTSLFEMITLVGQENAEQFYHLRNNY